MHRTLGSVFALLVALGTAGPLGAVEAGRVINVWPEGKMPGKGAAEPEQLVPQKADGYKRITNISEPTLTLFPATSKTGAPAPAVIVSPGGGYSYVVFDKEGTEIAAWLNAQGITALVLKYRVPRNRDGALQDLQRAISLVRTRASALSIDPARLGVIGFSAGGNVSAKASTRFKERTYPALDDVDRASCRPDFAMLIYPAYLDQDGKLAPDLAISSEIPPTLIVHTDDDARFVAGSKLYRAALDAAKVPNRFLLYPTGGHGYALHATGDVRVWPAAAVDWLRTIGVVTTKTE